MAELTGTMTTPVSDVMLARYVAGDLHGEQLARVERALGETPGLVERLERMKSERAAFLASAPAHQFAHQVVTRLTVERPTQAKWQVWWLLPPVTVATALLFGVVYQRALGPQSLSRPAVATDEAYQLPEEAKPIAAEPGAGLAAPERKLEDAKEAAETKSQTRDSAAKAEPVAGRDVAKNKGLVTGGGGGALDADKQSLRREDREHARKKDAPLGDLSGDGLGQQAFGAGRGAEGVSGVKGGSAQPPPPAKPSPMQPAQAQPSSPPVWAAPPAPATEAVQAERRAEARPADTAVETETRDREANAKTPAARPATEAPAPSTASSAGPAAPGSAAAKAKKAEAPARADEKSRGKSVESANEADDRGADIVATTVGISRDVGGRPRALGPGEVVASGTLLKITAQGGRYVTVIGVRRDGVPFVYGQTESTSGQPVVVPMRLRPASSRISEALFVVVGDAPVAGKPQVSESKDAAQLPLRLTVAGAQRRFVLTVSASAD